METEPILRARSRAEPSQVAPYDILDVGQARGTISSADVVTSARASSILRAYGRLGAPTVGPSAECHTA